VKRSSISCCLGLWAFSVSAQAVSSDRAEQRPPQERPQNGSLSSEERTMQPPARCAARRRLQHPRAAAHNYQGGLPILQIFYSCLRHATEIRLSRLCMLLEPVCPDSNGSTPCHVAA
jgi:hypothetical protein